MTNGPDGWRNLRLIILGFAAIAVNRERQPSQGTQSSRAIETANAKVGRRLLSISQKSTDLIPDLDIISIENSKTSHRRGK